MCGQTLVEEEWRRYVKGQAAASDLTGIGYQSTLSTLGLGGGQMCGVNERV